MTQKQRECETQLIIPDPKFLASYLVACQETYHWVHNSYIIHDPDDYENWKEHIFQDYQNQEQGINLPEGYVRSKTFWLVNGKGYIGTVNIRLSLTPALADYGGHLGVVIRRSERRKGYAKQALNLALTEAERLHIRPVLVTCTQDNVASRQCLLKSNYNHFEIVDTVADGKECTVYRFYFE